MVSVTGKPKVKKALIASPKDRSFREARDLSRGDPERERKDPEHDLRDTQES